MAIDPVEVAPERPSSLAPSRADHHSLFIGAGSSLYSVHLAASGK